MVGNSCLAGGRGGHKAHVHDARPAFIVRSMCLVGIREHAMESTCYTFTKPSNATTASLSEKASGFLHRKSLTLLDYYQELASSFKFRELSLPD